MRHLLLLALLALALPVVAQTPADTTGIRRVELVSRTTYTGVLVSEAEDAIDLRLKDGTVLRIPRTQIRAIGPALPGGFSRLDPNRSRLFVLPTARTIGRGTTRISNFYIVVPTVSHGLGNNVDGSLGATIPIAGNTVIGGSLKGRVLQQPGMQVALGVNAFTLLSNDVATPGIVSSLYGVVTVGSEISAATFGLVGGFATDFESVENAPGVALAGAYERQLSDNVKLITENWLLVGRSDAETCTGTFCEVERETQLAALLGGGVRFFSDRLSADLALAIAANNDGLNAIPLPYVSFSYTF